MSHYEINIQVNLTQVHGQPAGSPQNTRPASGLNGVPPASDIVLYGLLPNQAAVDEVMARLYELGLDLVLANVRSERTSHFVRDLQPVTCGLN
jgi:hypothetical protein